MSNLYIKMSTFNEIYWNKGTKLQDLLIPKILTASQENNSIHFINGIEYYKIFDYLSALKEFQLLESYKPQLFESFLNSGCCYLELGQIKKAILSFSKAISLKSIEIVYYNLALAYIYNHNFINASKAINLYTNSPSNDYLQLKRYIHSKDQVSLPVIIKKIRETEEEIAKGNIYKKKDFSSKSTSQLQESIQSSRDGKEKYRFKKIQSFDSRKFPLINKIPVVCKHKSTEIKRDQKKLLSISPAKQQISCITPQQLIYYGKGSKKKWQKLDKKPEFTACKMKFVQESLNNNAKALFSEQKFHKIFQSEANNFFENQSKEISNIANCYFYDPQSLESNYITKTQISDILYEYSKAPELRNYKYLDEITVKNYFFSRFPQEIRLKLLKISAPIEYNSGDIIFHEGEIGDDMYAIIRGSIVITKKSNIYKDQEIPIASLYDGRYFGELSLVPKEINESQGVRSVTCTAREQTLVFALSKIEYNHILLEQLEHDLDKKLCSYHN